MHKLENAYCVRCGLPADILTLECCGRQVTTEEKTRIRLGMLDFSDGRWKTYVSLASMLVSTESPRENFNQ